MITGSPKRFSAKSLEFSSVLEISREDFIQTLHQTPSDYELFCMFRDQITLYNDLSPLSQSCLACPETQTHMLEKCPFIHFIPNSDFVIQRHIYNAYQKRKNFKRFAKKRRNSLFFAAQNKFFALQVTYHKEKSRSDDENEVAYQEQSSILYPSDYSVESGEDDFSEEELNKREKSSNTLPSIKREKMDSLEVIDEESKSKSGTLIANYKSANELGFMGFPEDKIATDKFTTKILDTKAFDTKRQISATEIKLESKIMTEGGKLFEDYLKRNSLLSKQSSIGKANTTSLSEYVKGNPHYRNSNAVLSLTDGKSLGNNPPSAIKGRRNSIVMGTSHTNTGTKSNKSSKSKNTTVFDMFMDFDNLGKFESYFPENNCENIIDRLRASNRRLINSKKKNNRTESGVSKGDDRSFKCVNTLDTANPRKSHFVAFKKRGKKTSIENKSLF